MKCKFYSDYTCNYYENGLCHYFEKVFDNSLPQSCNYINDFEKCTCFEQIEDEKESLPYSLNKAEGKVLFKLLKEYGKDINKLNKIVEIFESYLSNASKSPANAEGKCSDEDTLYRVMKERIEDSK